MTGLKYSKYFLHELPDEQRFRGFGKMPTMVTYTDNEIIEGSHYFSAMVMGPMAIGRGHGPHTHETPEILVALGTDMENPRDLGGVMELCMGPEMEKHVVMESTIVFIPANFIHCPFTITRVDRPFLFIQAQYSPRLTETSYKKLIAESESEKYIFLDTDKE